MSDFIATSPCLQTRTPGQLLSLTSHLTFGSGESKCRNKSIVSTSSNFMMAINRQSKHRLNILLLDTFDQFPVFSFDLLGSPESDLDSSIQNKNNESHVSGVSPFFSSEDVNVSISVQHTNESVCSIANKKIFDFILIFKLHFIYL